MTMQEQCQSLPKRTTMRQYGFLCSFPTLDAEISKIRKMETPYQISITLMLLVANLSNTK